MTRPFAVSGFALAFSLIFSWFAGWRIALAGSCILLVVFLAALLMKKKSAVLLCTLLFCSLGMLFFSLEMQNRILPVQQLAGREAIIECEILDIEQTASGKYQYTLRETNMEISGTRPKDGFKVYLVTGNLGADYYDHLTFKALFPKEKTDNRYGAEFGTFAFARSDVTVTAAEKRPFLYYMKKTSAFISRTIRGALPGQEGAVVSAMVTGDKSGLSTQTKNNFINLGVYHLFAVSGIHVSIWGMLIFSLFRKTRKSRILGAFFTCGFILLYMAVTGFPYSVLRAGIMMIIYILGLAFFREADSLNSLGAAVTAILLVNPAAVTDASFVLSVLATLGVVTLGQYLIRRFTRYAEKKKLPRGLVSPVSVILMSVGVNLFTLPASFLFFRSVSWLSPLANVIFIPVATVVMVLGGLSVLFSFWSVLMYPAAFLSGLGAKLLLFLGEKCNTAPFLNIGVGETYLVLWLCCTMVLTGLAVLLSGRKSALRTTALISVLVLAVSCCYYNVTNRNLVNVYVFDSDTKSVLVTYRRQAVLIGSGYDYRVDRVLKDRNLPHLDLAVVADTDREDSGTADFLAFYSAERFFIPDANAHDESTLALQDDFSVKYEREGSGVLTSITAGGNRICVLTGDGAQSRLPDQIQMMITDQKLPDGCCAAVNIISGTKYAEKFGHEADVDGVYRLYTDPGSVLKSKLDSAGNYNVRWESY